MVVVLTEIGPFLGFIRVLASKSLETWEASEALLLAARTT